MVYTTQRFKIIANPAAQPISVGGQEGEPSPTSGYLPDWISLLFGGLGGGQQAPPINVGVPSTGSPDLIYEPPGNVSCPAGYALNNQNQCVFVPTSGDVGDITQVQVPSTSTAGGQAIIKTWFKNQHTSTLEYQVQIVITGLSINVTSPALSVAAGQTAMIETTINIPTTATNSTYSGVAQLKASGTTASSFVLQDSETFSLGVGVTVASGTAAITVSKTTVSPSGSISVTATGFQPGEVITFQAKVGTVYVAQDFKTADTTGTAKLGTLYFEHTSPLGEAIVKAKGTQSGRQAQKTITVAAPVGTIVVSFTQTTIARGQSFPITATGFNPGEQVTFVTTVSWHGVGIDTSTADSTGKANLHSMYIRTDAPTGLATVKATGATSGKFGTKTITVT